MKKVVVMVEEMEVAKVVAMEVAMVGGKVVVKGAVKVAAEMEVGQHILTDACIPRRNYETLLMAAGYHSSIIL